MNNPTATDEMKSNLGEAGSHLKSAAAAASEAIRGAAGTAVDGYRTVAGHSEQNHPLTQLAQTHDLILPGYS